MRPRDIALAVAVMAAWGVNFVAIDIGLDRMPPLLFGALRFGLAAVPAVFFVGRPQTPWRWVIAVGFILGVVKFGLLFAGMAAGMPAGLSSLVLQSQAVFTAVFAIGLLGERPSVRQWVGLAVAGLGIALIALRIGGGNGAFVLVVAAAAAWGLSNVAMRKAAPPDMLRFMVWVSAVATLPLLGLSLWLEEFSVRVDWAGVGALVYIAGISTLAGFAVWGALIRRYPAATVAPFSMLVPVFGMGSAAMFLGEPLYASDLVAGVFIVSGVLYGVGFAHGRRRESYPVPGR
ncbi:EamA family transporter [Allorhizocola rhizosphaerae]|uniref:EamA family transporter n=1 Tax=Allorhizocola rhizosphaerae TaxID=1872709 RepID=UPI000E3D56DF|nr:EamA family transporter [Allorhizocola rhizosphaerae]